MKIFFRNSFFFLLGLLLISFIIQNVVFALIKNIEVGEIGVVNEVMNGNINSDIVISGASRAFVGINPKIIEDNMGMSCYNISLNGCRLGTQVPFLKAYLKKNKKPKILIQELGMYSLTMDKKIFAPYKFIPYLNEEIIFEGLKKIDPYILKNLYIPLFNLTYFNTKFQKLLIKDYKIQLSNGKDYLINGFHPNMKNWSVNEELFLKNPHGIYDSIQPDAVNLLDEIIEICKKNKIKLILVNTPEYYKILPLYKNRDEIISIFRNEASKNNLIYLDYTKDKMTMDKSNFYNFTHLNDHGANIFTKILCNDILLTVTNDSI